MKTSSFALRFVITAATVGIAGLVGWQLWGHYMNDPWTRDGRVRADIVEVAPDVVGPVSAVFVQDNEAVRRGDALFQIDPVRFTLAIQQTDAAVAKARAAYDDASRNAKRNDALSNTGVVTAQSRDASDSLALQANAAYQLALANQAIARLDFSRSTVRAPVNGIMSNFSMQPGDYVTAGRPVAALVDTDSLYVDGYFEETKLRNIALGDPARVILLDGGQAITGHVAGIAAGITDGERVASANLLADVNPTFTWVRLPQRVPVRIDLDHIPAGTKLIAGLTATVIVEHAEAGAGAER